MVDPSRSSITRDVGVAGQRVHAPLRRLTPIERSLTSSSMVTGIPLCRSLAECSCPLNDYDKEVYEGDFGVVVNIDLESGEIIAWFEGRDLPYGFRELDALVPAYAAA